MFRGLNEECGVFGAININEAAQNVNLGLHMLQHRGQDGAGIISYDSSSKKYYKYKDFGLVSQIFSKEKIQQLKGENAIGHVRYATSGGDEIENIQPFLFYKSSLSFSLCHNGNIINSDEIKNHLEEKGSIFQSNSDSEILAHLIMQNYNGNIIEAIKYSLNMLDGAFAFLILFEDRLFACRDKYGLRPLSLSKSNDGYFISSETSAFSLVGADFIRDINPGEILEISKDNILSHTFAKKNINKMCAMEYIYFSRPDSNLLNKNVHEVRYNTGQQLAKEFNVDADIIIGVPDSSLSAALGFANKSKINYDIGLIKHKYVGRTFIEPTQSLRENSVKLKLGVIKSVVKDKKVVLVDDSIVRGTTSKKIISLLKDAGAKEIHVAIASPMITGACFYGVDIHTEEELIANNRSVKEICDYIGANSLHYLSLEGLKSVLKDQDICHGCFNKVYPTHLYKKDKRSIYE